MSGEDFGEVSVRSCRCSNQKTIGNIKPQNRFQTSFCVDKVSKKKRLELCQACSPGGMGRSLLNTIYVAIHVCMHVLEYQHPLPTTPRGHGAQTLQVVVGVVPGRLVSEPLGDVLGLSCGLLEGGLELGSGWASAMLWTPRRTF